MKTNLIIFLLISIIGIGSIKSQVITNTFEGTNRLSSSSGFFGVSKLPQFIEFDGFSEKYIVEQVQKNPRIFGEKIKVKLNTLNSGSWYDTPSGRVWKLGIHAKEAVSVNLLFSKFYLSENSELYIYNIQGDVVFGPVSSVNNSSNFRFGSDIIKGDKIILELHEASPGCTIEISDVVSGFNKREIKGYGDSESCHNDVNCPIGDDWQIMTDAACVIIVNGNEHCSGSLINNSSLSYDPYILTAFHCLDSNSNGSLTTSEQDAVDDWVFKFHWERTGCGTGGVSSGKSYYGSSFRSARELTDFALLELNSDIVNDTSLYLLGWDRSGTVVDSTVSLHHPSGDVMKISFDSDSPTATDFNGGANDHWEVIFDDGVVEHGSSGSPLLSEDQLVIGQLHGNDEYSRYLTYCSQPRAQYGRFDLSWTGGGTSTTRLSNWLDPGSTQGNTLQGRRVIGISGPELICSSTSFTISNAPTGISSSWSVTPSSRVSSSSGSGTSATITPSNISSNNGSITLSFEINDGSDTVTLAKTIWVGKPSIPTTNPTGTTPYPEIEVGTYKYVYISNAPGASATSGSWSASGHISTSGSTSGGSHSFYGVSEGMGAFYVTTTNACGASIAMRGAISVVDDGGGDPPPPVAPPSDSTQSQTSNQIFFNLYPNPTQRKICIDIIENRLNGYRNEANEIRNTPYTIRVFDFQMNLKKQLASKGKLEEIDLSELIPGQYLVQVQKGKKVSTKIIIVDR